ncbi:MAG: acyl carrier protein [Hirschia sp.]|nr:acyl carrier protein [Hirschia sp.]MBF19275.1 acyl carrier protein [Hirschia sp.]|tara:strand:- start:26 stop:295 length:270 start_codon:yes stop_codon:yes gene_type:complete
MEALETELKAMIVDVLNLEDLSPEEIGVEDDLFSDDGLALDSIDALELGVAIQKQYGLKLDNQDAEVKKHFQNVRSLATLVKERGGAAA